MNKSPKKIDLYSIYVNTITSAENRRQQALAVYFSLISAGAVLIGTVESVNINFMLTSIDIISFIWLLTIKYFRALAEVKFEVIKRIEKDWEFKPFDIEWKYLKSQKKWLSLTCLEMIPPSIILIYSVFFGVCSC